MASTSRTVLVFAITAVLHLPFVFSAPTLLWGNAHPASNGNTFPIAFEKNAKCQNYLATYNAQAPFTDNKVWYSFGSGIDKRFAILPLNNITTLVVSFKIDSGRSVIIEPDEINVAPNLDDAKRYCNYVVELMTTQLELVEINGERWAKFGLSSTILEVKKVEDLHTKEYKDGYIVICKENDDFGFGVVGIEINLEGQKTGKFGLLGLSQSSNDISATRWGSFKYLQDKEKLYDVVPVLYSGLERIAMNCFYNTKNMELIIKVVTATWNKNKNQNHPGIEIAPIIAWNVLDTYVAVVKLMVSGDVYSFVTLTDGSSPKVTCGSFEDGGNSSIKAMISQLYPTVLSANTKI